LAEPTLILTPPPKDTSDRKALERDDGFLTASEITTLKLDADWVVLSACNTAGPQGKGPKRRPVRRGRSFTRVPEHFWWRTGRWVSDAAVKLTARAFARIE
jgi:hypothetical protein